MRTAAPSRSPLALIIVAFIGLVVLGGIVGGLALVMTLGGEEEETATDVAATAPATPLPAAGEEADDAQEAAAEAEPPSGPAAEGHDAPPAPVGPQTDPWDERPIPSMLSAAKRQTDRHRRLSNRAMDRLRNYRRQNPEDIRAHLLLARGYLERGWRPDAMEWYENAYEASPEAAGDPRMLEDLVQLAAHARTSPRASRLLRQAYGGRAAEAMDRALASGDLEREDAARLRRIREGW